MEAMICDRCGGFFKKEKSRHGEFVTDYITAGVKSNIKTYDNKKFDLCPYCKESFDSWLILGGVKQAKEQNNG